MGVFIPYPTLVKKALISFTLHVYITQNTLQNAHMNGFICLHNDSVRQV